MCTDNRSNVCSCDGVMEQRTRELGFSGVAELARTLHPATTRTAPEPWQTVTTHTSMPAAFVRVLAGCNRGAQAASHYKSIKARQKAPNSSLQVWQQASALQRSRSLFIVYVGVCKPLKQAHMALLELERHRLMVISLNIWELGRSSAVK